MIDFIQAVIDLLTYTPTLYVDGIPCEVDCAWIGAVIGAATSLIGAGMSASASSSSASKMRKAAQKNYNMLMENAEMSKMSLNEQMESYEEDMASYRSSMIQRYGLAGGIRADSAQLNEVRDYQFDTEEIDNTAELNKKREEQINNYVENRKAAWLKDYRSDKDRNTMWIGNGKEEVLEKRYTEGAGKNSTKMTEREQRAWEKAEKNYRKEAEKQYGSVMGDKALTDAIGRELKNYTGRQTNWQGTAESSAILNLRTSVSNMQKDINNAYKAGMINYWQQRKNAQNVKDTQAFQAAGYSTQAQTTLASGFLSALQYGAQAYTQYKSGR